MHRSYELQGSLKRRRKHPHPTSINGYHMVKMVLAQSSTNGPHSLSFTKAGTHSPLLKGSHTAAHTPKHGRFGWGVVSLPSDCFTRFGNPAWPGGRTANFAAFGAWSWVLPKNAESLRNSDALMRVAVPRRRGPAGLRDLFRFCRNCGLHALFQKLLSVLQTLQLVLFLCKLRLSSVLFGSEFNGFRSKQAGFFAIILENV